MMSKPEDSIEVEMFDDPSVSVEETPDESNDSNFISQLKESVPIELFCKPNCAKCYGRQYESVMADTKNPKRWTLREHPYA